MRDRNLLQVQDQDQPIPWKVQFNLGNSSRSSNQCRNSIQGKHLITDELGKADSAPSAVREILWHGCSEGFLKRDFSALPFPFCSFSCFSHPLGFSYSFRVPAMSEKLGLITLTQVPVTYSFSILSGVSPETTPEILSIFSS